MNLKERFRENQIKNPLWSDYICLANAIRKTDSHREITQCFRLVDEDDYDIEDKYEILQYLKTRLGTP